MDSSNDTSNEAVRESLLDNKTLTSVDSNLFVSPVKRIGVSGGTAPFFRLELIQQAPHIVPSKDESVSLEEAAHQPEIELSYSQQSDKLIRTDELKLVSATKFIGKDLSRAEDEVWFYESLLHNAQSNSSRDALGSLCDFMFPYLGILKTEEEVEGVVENSTDDQNQLNLLVLENLFDQKKQLRLLDLKIGSQTASMGWKGKSYLAAFKQMIFDKMTNSVREGYRLEGFDGCPPALKSMAPLMEQLLNDQGKSKMSKKSRRLLYQFLEGTKIFQHLLDLHLLHQDDSPPDIDLYYDQDEYLEIIMNEIVVRTTKLVIGCHKVKIPQKWVGSSLAIGYDAGEIPSRSRSEKDIRQSTIVRIFDWGRSELNDAIMMKALSKDEVKNRTYFWNEYKNGIDTISWIATHKYLNRFCCPLWKYITFAIYDHDALSDHDHMCEVTVPMEETELREVPLLTRRGQNGGQLTYSIVWKEFPNDSRLKGAWKVKIGSGKDLPNMDFAFNCTYSKQTSDPYVVLRPKLPVSKKVQFPFEQHTKVVENNSLAPVWNETFSIPVCKDSFEALSSALEQAGLQSINEDLVPKTKKEWVNRVEASVKN